MCYILAEKNCQRGHKKLQKVVTFGSAYRLKESAVKRNNDKWMVVKLGSLSETETIPKEFYYHKKCWKSCCSKQEIYKIQNVPNADEVKRNECFEKLCQTIREKIINDGEVIRTTQIVACYKTILQEANLELEGCRSDNLGAKIERQYGQNIEFYKVPKKHTVFVYSSNVLGRLLHIPPSSGNLARNAKFITEEIKNIKSPFENWLPTANQLEHAICAYPKVLEQFLVNLLSAEKTPSIQVKHVVDSIVNDIAYNISGGQIKTIKHVHLALGVKCKTGSKKVIEWLNHLGHCISYAEVNAVKTKLAMDESKQSQNNAAYVPSVITPLTFVTFIWDNCDHICESIFGDMLHCMNGIIVQCN